MADRPYYERSRAELDNRYANSGWMEGNIGWVIGAIAIVLIVGGIFTSARTARTASIPDDATTGPTPCRR